MIRRYNSPKIEQIWSYDNKFKIWIEIECLIAEKLANLGKIPKKAAKEIRSKANYNVKEIEEIGQEYTRMKIEEDFGKNYIMGSATGGIGLDMEVQQLVDIGEDGEKEEYVDLYPVKDGRYII